MIIYYKDKNVVYEGVPLKTIIQAVKTIDVAYTIIPANSTASEFDCSMNKSVGLFLLTKFSAVNENGLNRYYIDADGALFEIPGWEERIEMVY